MQNLPQIVTPLSNPRTAWLQLCYSSHPQTGSRNENFISESSDIPITTVSSPLTVINSHCHLTSVLAVLVALFTFHQLVSNGHLLQSSLELVTVMYWWSSNFSHLTVQQPLPSNGLGVGTVRLATAIAKLLCNKIQWKMFSFSRSSSLSSVLLKYIWSLNNNDFIFWFVSSAFPSDFSSLTGYRYRTTLQYLQLSHLTSRIVLL